MNKQLSELIKIHGLNAVLNEIALIITRDLNAQGIDSISDRKRIRTEAWSEFFQALNRQNGKDEQ